MEIIVNDISDLLAVAAILVKNGYTVRQGRRKREGNNKAYDRILIVEKESS